MLNKIFTKKLLLKAIIFLLILTTCLSVSARKNDIHLKILDFTVDNQTGMIKYYFQAEKATRVNKKGKGNVQYRESPTDGEKSYFLLEPLPGLKLSDVDVQERPKGSKNKKDYEQIDSESDLKLIAAPKNMKIYSILLMDVSKSVLPVIDDLKKAALKFVDSTLKENRYLAIYAFDGREELILISDFSDNANEVKSKINAIDKSIMKDRSTNLYGAIYNSIEVLNKKLESENTPGFINVSTLMVFTDGDDKAGRLGPDGYDIVIKKIRDTKKKSNFYIYTVGMGKEKDFEKLWAFGHDGRGNASNISNLTSTFEKMGKQIDELSNSFYKIEYYTPSRKGKGKREIMIWVQVGSYGGGKLKRFDTDDFEF